MAFGTVSDPRLALALWMGVGAFVATAALLAAVAALRINLILRQRRQKALAARWTPLLAECAERVPETLPSVRFVDAVAFLALWVRAQESLRGEAQARLVEAAKRAGARPLARRLIRRGKPPGDLLGMIVLGHLRDEGVAPTLEPLLAEGSSVASLVAAQALLRIAPERALPRILATAARREDWPLARVASILQESDPAVVGPVLQQVLAAQPPGIGFARLVRLHGAAHAEFLRPVIVRVLETADEPEALCAALGALWHPQDAEFARRLAHHAQGAVRVAAVRALSRLGTREDAALLVRLLGDPSWWVRYRAAQGLCGLPGMDRAALESIRGGLTDRFAGDMLAQALAERAPA